MKIIVRTMLLMLGLFNAISSSATNFYVDPVKGSMTGDGSVIKPWHTLEEVISANLIETKDASGVAINKGAPIKSGDKLILNSGYHGFIQIKNAFNDSYITVTAGLRQKPKLSGLEVLSAKNWIFSKLTISPSFSSANMSTDSIVTMGASNFFGNCRNIIIRDSHIYSFNDVPETLTSADWLNKAKPAIGMGMYAVNVQSINNYINNVSRGISIGSENSIAQGNIITDISNDGIRVSVKNAIIEDNVIKNTYSVDSNHADAIQGFSGNPLNLNTISITGNIILNRDKIASSYSNAVQGIGFFDGPINNIKVRDNVIMVFTYHGIALYDSINGTVTNNTVFTPAEVTNSSTAKVLSWITLSTKNRGGNINNFLTNNTSHKYVANDSIGLINTGNITIPAGTGNDLFMQNLTTRLNVINAKYGAIHPVSNQTRVDSNFILNGVSTLF